MKKVKNNQTITYTHRSFFHPSKTPSFHAVKGWYHSKF